MLSEDAVYKIIQDTWTSTLGFDLERTELGDFSAPGAFTVCVRIAGAWDGEVRLLCPPTLARLIAAAIFQVDADQAMTPEILDALSELIHIVGGNLKALLPQPVTLSLPSILDPNSLAPTTHEQWECRLPLMSNGHAFVVTIKGNHSAQG